MAKGIMIVLSNPIDATREDDYNDWYNNVHIPELLVLDGFVAARRFRVLDEGAEQRFAAVYELEADDLTSIMDVIGKAVVDEKIHMTDAIEMEPPAFVRLCEEL